MHKKILLVLVFPIIQKSQDDSYPHVMWWGENSLRAEHLLAVGRRIPVGLEEGNSKVPDKTGGEIRTAGHEKKALQKREAGCLHGREKAQPLFFLLPEQGKPVVKQFRGNEETLTEFFNRGNMPEILCQDPEDEKEAIGRVRDDKVWKDGMGMSAGTNEPQDTETVPYRLSSHEIDQ